MNKNILISSLRKKESAVSYWKRNVLPYATDSDDLELIGKCLSKSTLTHKQARYLHLIACRQFESQEAGHE